MPTLHLKLTVEGAQLEAAVNLPDTPSPRRVLLPILQNLTDAIVNVASQSADAAGAPVTCSKGCDACCRQMVPISPTEAHAFATLLDSLEPSHAQRIRTRFAIAQITLERLALLPRLQNHHALTQDQLHQLDRDYFAAQIPCPFLEEKSCSIHPHRPLACREFLVTSHPRHCANPADPHLRQLPLPKPSTALQQLDPPHWVPLILSLDHAQAHVDPPSPNPAADLQSILHQL